AQYVGGIIAYLAAGGGGHGAANGLSITQYSSTFTQLVYLGVAFGVVYFIAAPFINKLMHGVK
ncbi:MAG: hypothetical protein ACO3KY_12940, partial [Lysobacterales bacterium]